MQRVLCFLLMLMVRCSFAAVIPPSGSLPEKVQQAFNELQKTFESDSKEALRLSRGIYTDRFELSSDNQAWAQFQYAYLLLENDSIAKAALLLSDTAGLELVTYNEDVRSFQQLGLGVVSTYNGNYAKADSLLSSAKELARDPLLQSEIHQALAVNYWLQGKLDMAFGALIAAHQFSNGIGDSSEIADCDLGFGIVAFLQGDLEQAEVKFSDHERFHERSGNKKKTANARSMLGLVAYQQRQFDRSIELALSAYRIRQEIADLKGQGESLNNLALGHIGLKNWSQALRYLQDALNLKVESNDLSQINVVYENMGFCYQMLGKTDEAIAYYTLALDKSRENGQVADMITSYQYLISVYAKEKADFKKAFALQSEMITLKDSLAYLERSEKIKELEIRYQADQKEQEIELLRKEQSITTNRWLTLALMLFFLMIVGILFYDSQKRKYSQERELKNREEELREAELKIMSGLLDQNKQKLALYTESLLKKNELVNRLELKLKDASDEPNSEKTAVLENIQRVRILTDDDWEEFKKVFDGVHRGLLERLLIRYPSLTLGEQRLFLLMKLAMSTKQIADILGVSPESVKKSRYRLKRKLNPEDGVELQTFIDAF